MQLGIIDYEYQKENFLRVKNLGLQFMELCINIDKTDLVQKIYDDSDLVLKNIEETGITIGSIGRWGSDRINKDGSICENELHNDELLIKAAGKVKCPVFVCGCNYAEELSLYENYQAAIAYFQRLLATGKEAGVKIATYNCRWNNFVHSDPAWSIIHGYLKDLYIKFDPSHSIYAKGENYLSEINKWGDRFAHVHIKGSLLIDGERVDDPPAGLDMTDWNTVMGLLYAKGYDAGLSIEPHSGIWQGELGERGIKQTVAMMKRHIV